MRYLLFTLLALSMCSFANENPIEEVIAYGIRPGPELWKVTNGENVLWILGTLSPLPKKMVWHTEIVEIVIENSQALLLAPSVTADIGFFQSLSLATSAIGIKKNPNKQHLQDVIPADLYTRWLVLKKKYMGNNNGIEKTRPIFAANKLFEAAIKKIGLKSKTKIRKKIRKMAKRNKLEFIEPKITLDLIKPKSALKKFKKTQISDLECFAKTLERIEVDLVTMRLRANAWANGDVDKIRSLEYPNENKACTAAILNSDIAQDVGMKNIRSRLRTIWLEEAKKALTQNKSTFAILPISNLLNDKSYLKDLAAAGYTVIEPK